MPKQTSSEQDQVPGRVNQEGAPEDRHADWGQSPLDAGGNTQSGARGNIGGVPGSQHNDWGHSPVDTAGGQGPGAADRKRQGIMPGNEMGHLQRRKTDK